MSKVKVDPALDDARAILSKLQRLEVALEEDPGSQGRALVDVAARQAQQLPAQQPAPEAAKPKTQTSAIAAAVLALGTVGAGMGILFSTVAINPNGNSSSVAAQGEAAVLSQARQFLALGGIAQSRSMLLRSEPDKRPEVAYLLAQSFDPTYLANLPRADSRADVAEATRWYRTWYALSAEAGHEVDGGRLQRLIAAMQRR